LTGATEAIRNVVRSGDIVFRYGGDEIVLVIPDEGLENVVSLTERVRAAVCQIEFKDEEAESFRLTASFGVATYPETSGEGGDWAEVFGLADEAMYVIKRNGGNGVHAASLWHAIPPAASLIGLAQPVEVATN
jgi:diguanylate cyclase (GGDEF)-like protein